MDINKKIARMVGVLFIIGTVAGILSAFLIPPILNAPDYLFKFSENKNMVIWGVLLILTMGISLSMMSVVLFPVLKKYNEVLALGAVIFRGVLELVCYLGIAISWILLLTLSQEYVRTDTPVVSNFQLIGTMLKDLAFYIGSTGLLSVFFSIGAIIIYYVFYKTKLIPTWLSLWGFFGAMLYLVSPILIMFGFQMEFLQYPLGVQEMIMAGWLIVKGFNSSAFNFLMTKQQIE
ncbi:DUF4386 domain-containing protein [Acetobacterium sp.]|uniref:DUF4386 domain-containing protein n=1 Tax=Acetobacterium sp. TaxID=1872094 RepID=UPI002F421813